MAFNYHGLLFGECFLTICLLLIAIIEKYGNVISQWARLCQVLLEVSIKTMWINVHIDDWTVKGQSLLVMLIVSM